MDNIDGKILNLFKKMINDIMEVYPEEKGSIYEKYESIMNMETLKLDECELLQNFLKKINENSTKITNKEVEVLQDDLIEGIPLKKIWKSEFSFVYLCQVMVKVSHEVPLFLLEKSLYFNDYDYCLPHLLDENETYRNFFIEAKKNGRYIIMDNSLHELGKANKINSYWPRPFFPAI